MTKTDIGYRSMTWGGGRFCRRRSRGRAGHPEAPTRASGGRDLPPSFRARPPHQLTKRVPQNPDSGHRDIPAERSSKALDGNSYLVTWRSRSSATLGGTVQTLRVAPRIPKEVDLRRKVCRRFGVTRLPRLMPGRFSAVDGRLDILRTHGFPPPVLYQNQQQGRGKSIPTPLSPYVVSSIAVAFRMST